jgi:putative transposase
MTRFTDGEGYFVSEASVYRLLKAHDLIAIPAFIVVRAGQSGQCVHGPDDRAQPALADRLHLSQGHRRGLVLPVDGARDFSRYILAWKLCTTMKATDVTDTLQLALTASGLRYGARRAQAPPAQRQRLKLPLRQSRGMARRSRNGTCSWSASSSPDPGQDRALASDA